MIEQIKQHDNAGGQARKAGQAGQVAHSGVFPHDLVQAAEPEHDHIDRQYVGQHGGHGADGQHPLVGVAAVKPQHDRQPVAEDDQPAVQQHQGNAPRQTFDDLF